MTDKQDKSKKIPEAPKTEISQHQDKSTNRFVFWMVFITVLIVIVGGAAIYWLAGEYVKQSNKNKSQDITIGLLNEKKKDLAELKPNYDKINQPGENGKSDADLILNAMPEDRGYDSLIAMLERMGGEAGVKIKTISSAKKDSASGGEKPISYEVTVALDGTSAQIFDFLTKTEKSSRVLDFVSMNLGGEIGGTKNNATITMNAYYQKPANINSTYKELE